MFTVPSFTPSQEKIPFARVNHNKYMVTDKVAYIGESVRAYVHTHRMGAVGWRYVIAG